jgi:drug/metabolite transporter (DMT)-like permease
LIWIATALVTRASYAGCNVLDSHYRHHFGSGYSQLFYCNLYWVAIIPLVMLAAPPMLPALELWPWIIVSGFCGAVYLVPYFAALRTADSSVIAALFALGCIFTPVLAAVLVNEQLSVLEIAGFLVTISGAVFLSWKPGAMHFDTRSLLLMGASGFLSALGLVCSKNVFNNMPIWDGFLWITLTGMLTIVGFILVPAWRKTIQQDRYEFPKIYIGFSSTFFLGITAEFFSYLTVSLTKNSYAAMMGQFQPFFVLSIVALVGNGRGLRTMEDLSGRAVVQKIAAFIIISSGVILAVWPEA